jgi:hypothetical protein
MCQVNTFGSRNIDFFSTLTQHQIRNSVTHAFSLSITPRRTGNADCENTLALETKNGDVKPPGLAGLSSTRGENHNSRHVTETDEESPGNRKGQIPGKLGRAGSSPCLLTSVYRCCSSLPSRCRRVQFIFTLSLVSYANRRGLQCQIKSTSSSLRGGVKTILSSNSKAIRTVAQSTR